MFSTSRSETGKSWSIALRLTAWYLCASFIILLTATVVLYFILDVNLRRDHDQFLIGKIGVIRALLREKPDDLYSLKEEVEQTWAPRQYVRVYGRVIGANGQLLAESPEMATRVPADTFPSPSPLDQDPEQGVALRSKAGESLRAVSALAQVGRNPGNRAVIQVALDTQLSGELLAGYRRTLLMVLGIGLAICAVTGYSLARSGLRPLRQITQAVQQIHSSTLDKRVPTTRLPAELSALVASFNSMLERLQEAFDRLSRFSADIAHELRTPVNNLRIEVEVALNKARSMQEYQETLGSCLEECGRLSRIIDSMLFIARAEDPRTQIHKEAVDIGNELERVREFYEAPAGEAGVDLQVSCPSGTFAPVDRTLFQRAIGNLVANAIRHTPKGGRIELAAERQNGQLAVKVADTGAGIDPQDLPRIFDRFYRADRARSGGAANVGLGLAIVKSIVLLHGGSIAVESRPNAGTRMRIQLPA